MGDNHVLRVNSAEEETLFRAAVSETIARIIAENACTLIDIAERIDVSVKTISNAFNRTHSLSQCFLNRLGLAFGPHVLDPVAKLSGARMVALDPIAGSDILPFIGRANLAVAEARDPESPGGTREVHSERFGYLPYLRALQRELSALICQIEAERDAVAA